MTRPTSEARAAHYPALVAAVGVGLLVVGSGRRLHELRQTRTGAVAPLGPATRTVPGRQGALAARVDRWEPAPPRTRAGRLATAAWAAPLTTVGGLLARLGGAGATWDDDRGCWVATGVRGPSAVLLRALGLSANAIGHVVVVRRTSVTPSLLDHESVHVRQAERLGPLLPLLYAWFSARYGYRENPFERAARAGAARRADR